MHRGRDWTARGLALVAIAVGIGGGTAFAATKHYLITSTKQIKPSVLKSLKKAGPRGAKGAIGSQGAQGNAGANGTNGTNGTNGVNGAVAGYSGTGQVSMGTQMQLTVLTKTLPAGSYVISGSVAVQAQRPGATPSSTGASVQCGLTLSGSGTVNETFTSPWDAQVDETADGTISFATAGKLTSPGTVTISCTNYSGPGGAQDNGTYASIGLIGYVTAVQTTSNS